MSRKGRIIFSITGIMIVSLFLITLTYGYYVTKIKGNTNDTSINLITDSLELVYSDDDGSIIGANQLIVPDTTFEPKIFSVENKGKSKIEYAVTLDNVSITDLSTGEETTFESNDFVYTLTCSSGCNSVSTETTLPLYNNGVLVTNTIDKGEKQTYQITITYKDTGVDQSNDMNKSLSARLNIMDPSTYNPYKNNTSTLAYNIINNAILGTNGTTYFATPLTTPAKETSLETEKVLSVTTDDYGTSYYYRGGVEDNYVNFAEMCWRIVRIEGDGLTKLILEDYNTTCNSSTFAGNWSDGNYYTFDSVNPTSFVGGNLATAFKTFQTSKLVTDTVDYTTKLKSGDWCFDDTKTIMSYGFGYDDNGKLVYNENEATNGWTPDKHYGAYTRINTDKKPSLNCTGTKLTKYKDGTDMYVATLTADEISFAGATGSTNYSYYLMNDYAKNNYSSWLTLSPSYFSGDAYYFYSLYYDGNLNNYGNYEGNRPAVSLKSNTIISGGTGFQTDPYTIK